MATGRRAVSVLARWEGSSCSHWGCPSGSGWARSPKARAGSRSLLIRKDVKRTWETLCFGWKSFWRTCRACASSMLTWLSSAPQTRVQDGWCTWPRVLGGQGSPCPCSLAGEVTRVDCAEGLALRQHCCLGLQGFLGIPEGAFAKVAPCLAVHVDCPPHVPAGKCGLGADSGGREATGVVTLGGAEGCTATDVSARVLFPGGKWAPRERKLGHMSASDGGCGEVGRPEE